MPNREILAFLLVSITMAGWQMVESIHRRRFETAAISDRRDIRQLAETTATDVAGYSAAVDRLPWRRDEEPATDREVNR